MVLDFAVLAASLLVLVKASNVTIEKAARLSKLTGISHFVIGFIFVAVSTSLPELSIAVISAAAKENHLSFGNLVGANITLLTLVLGIMIFAGFRPKRKDFIELDQAVIITTIMALFLIALKISNLAVGLFAVILFYVFSEQVAREGVEVGMNNNNNNSRPASEKIKAASELVVSVLVVVGAAYFVTNSAVAVSRTFGIAETIIGATLISLGTTLPELSVNIAAIRKKDFSLAVGDTIGSMVTNLTLILGISSMINPIAVGRVESFVLGFFVLASLVFLLMATRFRFDRLSGAALIGLYFAYLLSLVSIL
ncbi:MAG: sodium:calcium antiporter [Candidatus Aenigmarchaeota archaeon]|nr:sodium:calcium antiporter [Candidatus Aenigmarchaeota archaeon]